MCLSCHNFTPNLWMSKVKSVSRLPTANYPCTDSTKRSHCRPTSVPQQKSNNFEAEVKKRSILIQKSEMFVVPPPLCISRPSMHRSSHQRLLPLLYDSQTRLDLASTATYRSGDAMSNPWGPSVCVSGKNIRHHLHSVIQHLLLLFYRLKGSTLACHYYASALT